MNFHMNKTDEWTEIIQAKRKLLYVNIKELWRYRDLIAVFVKRDITVQYKQTVLGPLWLFIAPLFTIALFTFVFNRVAGLPTDEIPPPLFYLSGTLIWGYFQNCFNGAASSLNANAHLFGKVYFPRLSVPISIICSSLLKLAIQSLLFMVLILYYSIQTNWTPNYYILLIPVIILLLATLGLGGGLIIASITTRYRDFAYMLSFGMSLLMYATPVIYPLSAVPASYQFWIRLNPLSSLIENFRYGVLGSGVFSWQGLLYSTGISMLLLFIGLQLFQRVEKDFIDRV